MDLFKKYNGELFPRFADQVIDIDGKKIMIRTAQAADAESMVEVERAVYVGQAPWAAKSFLIEISKLGQRQYLVATVNGQVIAFIGATFLKNYTEVHITNLAVSPVWQNHNIGSKLIKIIAEQTNQLNINLLTLEVRKSNEAAQRLYQRLGFKITGEKVEYYDNDHENALDMALYFKMN